MTVNDFVFCQRRFTIFKVPPDVEKELRKKYPNIEIDKIVHDIFDKILQKCFQDGSCTIREFGKFDCFKVFSSRIGREQVRFKFKTTVALINKIRNDSYLLDGLVSAKSKEFNDEHKKRCEGRDEQKRLNYEARKLASSKQKKNTEEKLVKQKILDMINNQENIEE